jgi:hypothetical protein
MFHLKINLIILLSIFVIFNFFNISSYSQTINSEYYQKIIYSKNCPQKTYYDNKLKLCADENNVYGIFTKEINNKCGKSISCNTLLEYNVDNNKVKLQRYSKTLYIKLKGNSICPTGSKSYTLDQDYCIENNSKDILGYFNPFFVKVCKLLLTNSNCYTNKISEKEFNIINDKIKEIGKALFSTRTFMYHGFEKDKSYKDFMLINQEDFESQIRIILDNNYKITTTNDIINDVLNNKPLSEKRAIFQADDGYSSILLANDVINKIEKEKGINIPLEIGLVVDNVGKSEKHLTLDQYKILIKDGNTVISHTKSHCSLGSETQLNFKTGTGKVILPPTSDCQFYKSPNNKYLSPLSLENNIKQHFEAIKYIKENFDIEVPTVIYPYGHNSTQNTNILKIMGLNFGYSTINQKVCNADLIKQWKDSNSNYNIPRTTVSGYHKDFITNSNSWFNKSTSVNNCI